MNRGRKQWLVPSVCGAVLLAAVVIFPAAGQRGGLGSGPVTGGSGDENAIGHGAAGLDRTFPGQEQPSPSASDPAVKAKLDHEQNIKDAALLAQWANEVKHDLESGGSGSLSAPTLKKSEDLAKLAKKLHDRMKSDYASAPKSTAIGTATSRTSPKQ